MIELKGGINTMTMIFVINFDYHYTLVLYHF